MLSAGSTSSDKPVDSNETLEEVKLDILGTRITVRQPQSRPYGGVNVNNLVPVPLERDSSKSDNCGLRRDKLKLTVLNAQSVVHKASEVADFILDQDADICALTETWLKSGEKDVITRGQLTPAGYSLIDAPRLGRARRSGGIAILFRSHLKVKQQKVSDKASFEATEVLITNNGEIIRLCVVYRPGPGTVNAQPPSIFFNEFYEYIDELATTTGKLLVVGDFNFHMDKCNNETENFKSLIHCLNLEQHVSGPTHKKGHTLDLVLTRSDELFISDLYVQAPIISDHSGISFSLPMEKSLPEKQTRTYRCLKDIDVDAFEKDILQSSLHTSPAEDVNDLVNQYNTVLTELLDKHAPPKTKLVTVRARAPWFNEEILSAKRDRRKAERKWRSSKLQVHYKIFKCAHRKVVDLCHNAKKSFYCDKIKEHGSDQKQLWKIANDLLFRKKASPLPTHVDSSELANDFATFFSEKIQKIRESFPSASVDPHEVDNTGVPMLNTLQPTSVEELRKLICSGNTKSCLLDPIPTSLLKECLDVLLPILVRIVNLSFASNTFPKALKIAMVIPLLKKIILDYENRKNYRPVSNLPFLGKVIEKTSVSRLSSHTTDNNLEERLQSAYRPYHSVETALLVVMDDMLCAIDKGQHVLITLLDYSAAFDTIGHDILFRRLEDSYGITGDALEWVKSYFGNRYQAVCINGVLSEKHALPVGMPQGSYFGPFGYPKYSAPIAKLAQQNGVMYHQYADDTQLYVFCDAKNAEAQKSRLEQCIHDIKDWSASNLLKLNDSKTEFLVVGSAYAKSVPDIKSIQVGEVAVEAGESARNIGMVMDERLTMKEHIHSVCKAAYAQLRNIALIRRHITQNAAATLIQSLVISRLDNMNSLLYGLPDSELNKLQRIQNHAAKVVLMKKKSDHVTPLLMSLHWLRIPFRIEYKLLLLTYKCLNGKAPEYLASLLGPYKPQRQLRSCDQDLLAEKRARLKTYGMRAFSVAAPKLWNKLPLDVRNSGSVGTFKSKLKTHLFKKCYEEA